MTDSQRLYEKLQDWCPEWIELFNYALVEAYIAGQDDGYSTTGNQSGMCAAMGELRNIHTYEVIFPNVRPITLLG